MRLMKRDERELIHLRPEEKQSDYIGTVTELSEVGTVKGIVNPVTDRLSAELYGTRVLGMVSVTLLSGNPVKNGDILRFSGADYKVLSIAHYQSHDLITAERTDTDGA